MTEPTFVVVCDRSVTLIVDSSAWNSADGSKPGLRIVRVQNLALVPAPSIAFDISQLIRQEHPWTSAAPAPTLTTYELLSGPRWQGSIRPFDMGVAFAPPNSNWAVIIHVPPRERAAFAYEVVLDHSLIEFHIRCVCTANVIFTGHVTLETDGSRSNVLVECAIVDLTAVPPQGSVLAPSKYKFQGSPPLTDVYSAGLGTAVQVFIFLVNLNPISGALFGLVDYWFTVATGQNLWGLRRQVDIDDLYALGSAALFVGASPLIDKAIAKLAQRYTRELVDILDRFKSVQKDALSPRFQEALAKLSDSELSTLATQMEAFAAGKIAAADLMKTVEKTVVANLGTETEVATALPKLMSQDAASFVVAEAAEDYAREISGGTMSDPLKWALQVPPLSQSAQALARQVGAEYRVTIEAIQGSGRLVRVSSDEIAHITAWNGKPMRYADAARLNKGFGNVSEADHMLEQRFAKAAGFEHDPSYTNHFVTLIVPKSPAIARQIPNYSGYCHYEKTSMMRFLIPHGAEDLFTAQQLWDAHAYTFQATGLGNDLIMGEFKKDFEMLIGGSAFKGSDNIIYRLGQRPSDFLSANWPG